MKVKCKVVAPVRVYGVPRVAGDTVMVEKGQVNHYAGKLRKMRETKSDSKMESKSETKPETKSDSKMESKSETKPETKSKSNSKGEK